MARRGLAHMQRTNGPGHINNGNAAVLLAATLMQADGKDEARRILKQTRFMYESKRHRGWAYYACIGLLGASISDAGNTGEGLLLMRDALEQLEVMREQIPSHQRFLVSMVRARFGALRETEQPDSGESG